jgi:hypothetical protein
MINFGEKIEEVLLERRERTEPDNEFHCHYAGHCKRQIWNSKKHKKEFGVDVLGKMMTGTIIHNWMANTFRHLGRNEVPFELNKGDIVIKGTADFIDGETIYDFKSEASLKYLPRVENENGDKHRTFRDFHEPQLQLYLDGFGMTKGALVYIDKVDLKTKQFEIQRNEKMIAETIDKYREVHKELSLDTNPFDYCECFMCKKEKDEVMEVEG